MKKQEMEQLYLSYEKIVFGYLLRLTHNRDLAEELSQETFYQAFLSMDRYDGRCRVSSWLCQIAKNIWRNDCRKKKRITSIDDMEAVFGETEDALQVILKKEERVLFYRELQKLPQDMKDVIYLRIAGEFTFQEIGEILGRSEVWARTVFYRGKKKIMKEV